MHTKIQPLLDWLKTASDNDVAETGTTRGYLRRIAYGQKTASAEMSSGIERATIGAVTRKTLRVSDWELIWPELAEHSSTLNANVRPKASAHQSADGAGNPSSALEASAR
ncbi:hypothetical protein [Pseudomonas aphyarum]|uniref:Helix-turn-helix domain-containing protein n=1 Tax=Pseudomonas aphyarum TaxID=2942629 RepID=A0ABT5PVA4_9PSED|nr:hypothetical protein [Pseudomonas aphyarum]MDD0969698.1 helix-turn-helix domain-containing protein [Pseudomonas aphyarum]MDD1127778.1 helix-turn-helix domain-containing protein [Pseudomonas aphyarum]